MTESTSPTSRQERGSTMAALEALTHVSPQATVIDDGSAPPLVVPSRGAQEKATADVTGVHPVGAVALIGLRLSLGFLFLWAFLDKTFGLGYSTPSAHAWIRGGSPPKGFLSGANVGPL